jgi:hypothetical protein
MRHTPRAARSRTRRLGARLFVLDFFLGMRMACVVLWCWALPVSAAPRYVLGPRTSYEVDAVSGMAAGDFNGDHRTDLAAVGQDVDGNPEVLILFGQHDGTFRTQDPALEIPGNILPFDAIAAGDFSLNDGRDDIALLVPNLDTLADELQVFTNLGGTTQVTFQAPSGGLPVGEGAVEIDPVDLNGDGFPDLAVPNTCDGNISLFLKQGNTFLPTAQSPLATGRDISDPTNLTGGPVSVAASLLNSDALPDLAIALNQDEGVAIHLNSGSLANPSFGPPSVYDPDPDTSNDVGPTGIVLADFNGDHRPDVAMTNDNGTVTVHLNQGGGIFGDAIVITLVHDTPLDGLVTADLDGDSKPDLILRASDDTVTVLFGNGDGTFTRDDSLTEIPVGSGMVALSVADFNGDGKLDIAVAEASDNTVSVLLGGGIAPPPTPSFTVTRTGTATRTPTITQTPTMTPTFSRTPTPSRTLTRTVTPTPTATRPGSPTATPASTLPGDADCNGILTEDDPVALERRIFDPSFFAFCNGADANRDGAVSSADLSATLRALFPP